jgi:hypothetical protein
MLTFRLSSVAFPIYIHQNGIACVRSCIQGGVIDLVVHGGNEVGRAADTFVSVIAASRQM